MSALRDVIAKANAKGVTFRLTKTGVVAVPDETLNDAQRAFVRQNQAALTRELEPDFHRALHAPRRVWADMDSGERAATFGGRDRVIDERRQGA